MNKKNAIILSVVLVGILIAAIPIAVYLVRQQQTTKSSAETNTQTVCQTPGTVSNVTIEYPFCEQGSTLECSFTQASCSWNPVSEASSYGLKITEVDSGTVIKTDSVSSSTTKIAFPVTSGKTYKCDVTATNSCGSTGGTGTDSLLCKVDEVALATPTPPPAGGPSPTPTPSGNPTPTPPPVGGLIPTPTPTVTPKPQPKACGQACDTSEDCGSGMTCVKTANNFSYCALDQYQNACIDNPSVNTCCQAPTKPNKPPVLAKAGLTDNTTLLIGGGLLLIILSAVFLVF